VSVKGSPVGDTAESARTVTATLDVPYTDRSDKSKASHTARYPAHQPLVGAEGEAGSMTVTSDYMADIRNQLAEIRNQNERLMQIVVEQHAHAASRDAEIVALKDTALQEADCDAASVETEATEVDPFLVDTAGAARLLCLAPSTVYAMFKDGKIPKPVRIGSKLLWRVDELRRWVEAGCPGQAKWEALSR